MATEFAKELGLKEVVSIAIGAMIGGGIFSVLGRLAGLAGPFAIVSFFLGGIIALLTAHSYVRLVSKYPSSGGEFVIFRRGFSNPLVGNVIGALLWLGYSVTIALYAFTFGLYVSEWMYEITYQLTGSYIQYFNPNLISNPDVILNFFSFRRLMAAFSIFLFMIINLKGVKETGTIQDIIVAFKLGVLLLLVVVGLFFIKGERFVTSWKMVNQANNELVTLFNGIFVGGAIIFVSYEGFEVITHAVEEMKNPARDVKIGMYISVITVMITYIGVTFVTIGMVDGTIDEAALIQAVDFMGPIAVTLITLAAITSTTSAINATLLGTSRLAYVMSDWRAFPKRLAKISKTTHVPYLVIILSSVIAMGFTFLGNANTIAEVASILFLIIFLSMNFSVTQIYPNNRNYIAKIATILIIGDLILAMAYIVFIEESILTLTIFLIFATITIIWMFVNLQLQKRGEVKNDAYLLQPLGTDLIQEFKFVDSSDQFFSDLNSILLPIAGKTYETKSVEVATYLARKYNVKITLVHILQKENGNNSSDTNNGVISAEIIMKEYDIPYHIITRKSDHIPQAIVDIYHEGDYQLIVLASRRKSGLIDKLFVESISKYVVNHVKCAVLQVHPPRYKSKEREIGDIFLMLDGSERDAYLSRWAKMVSSVGIESKVYSYHVLELPGIFPLDEAHKVSAIELSKQKFENYAIKLGERFGLYVWPVFLYGHNIEKAIYGESIKFEPDVIIIGHTKDKGIIHRLRSPLSYRLMNKLDATVIVYHMPSELW